MQEVRWGIIGCGAVTEVKSGPGFQKAARSSLVAVMRRTAALARDYAARTSWVMDRMLERCAIAPAPGNAR